MIVDPDFFDHWRTGMVVDALQDPAAPIYIMRLWGHCQERRADTFVMPTRGLKSQCKFPGDAQALEDALIEAGFITRDGNTIHVCGWADKNSSLLAAWSNGSRGGRPKKKPKGGPDANPGVSDGQPSGGPVVTGADPIREEKRREEEGNTSLRSVLGLFDPLEGEPGAAPGQPPGPPAPPPAPPAAPAAPAPKRRKPAKPSGYTADFEAAWDAYPRRPGDSKKDAFKAYSARLATGATAEQLLEGAKRYAAYAEVRVSEPQFLKQGATFFGPGEHYLADWTIPKVVVKPPPASAAQPLTVESRAAERTAQELQARAARVITGPTQAQREAMARATDNARRKAAAKEPV